MVPAKRSETHLTMTTHRSRRSIPDQEMYSPYFSQGSSHSGNFLPPQRIHSSERNIARALDSSTAYRGRGSARGDCFQRDIVPTFDSQETRLSDDNIDNKRHSVQLSQIPKSSAILSYNSGVSELDLRIRQPAGKTRPIRRSSSRASAQLLAAKTNVSLKILEKLETLSSEIESIKTAQRKLESLVKSIGGQVSSVRDAVTTSNTNIAAIERSVQNSICGASQRAESLDDLGSRLTSTYTKSIEKLERACKEIKAALTASPNDQRSLVLRNYSRPMVGDTVRDYDTDNHSENNNNDDDVDSVKRSAESNGEDEECYGNWFEDFVQTEHAPTIKPSVANADVLESMHNASTSYSGSEDVSQVVITESLHASRSSRQSRLSRQARATQTFVPLPEDMIVTESLRSIATNTRKIGRSPLDSPFVHKESQYKESPLRHQDSKDRNINLRKTYRNRLRSRPQSTEAIFDSKSSPRVLQLITRQKSRERHRNFFGELAVKHQGDSVESLRLYLASAGLDTKGTQRTLRKRARKHMLDRVSKI
eukprot:1389288-Amorphochlora_amoeboformis.AAC.1